MKMAWRPTEYLIKGTLDNAVPGKVTGWIKFAGKKQKVMIDLKGDFHRDIRGAKIVFKGDASDNEPGAAEYMDSFSEQQKGKAGDITAGYPPADYVSGRCYIEWYSEDNGRVVIELEQNKVQIIGTPIPASKCEPISRKEQNENMAKFMTDMAREWGKRE